MEESEKVILYNMYKQIIHAKIKSDEATKPLWRRLYWTTAKDSNKYKAGCFDIYIYHFPEEFKIISKEK